MTRKKLLAQIKQVILAIEPGADIILYGSRARGRAGRESDWDLLVLVDGPVDRKRVTHIRHCLFDIELEQDEIISSIVEERSKWQSLLYRQMPFHENVEREGVLI